MAITEQGGTQTTENASKQEGRLLRRGVTYFGVLAAGLALTGAYRAGTADGPVEIYQRTYGEDSECMIAPAYDKYYGATFRVAKEAGKLILYVIPSSPDSLWLSRAEQPELKFTVTDPRFSDAVLLEPVDDITSFVVAGCNKE